MTSDPDRNSNDAQWQGWGRAADGDLPPLPDPYLSPEAPRPPPRRSGRALAIAGVAIGALGLVGGGVALGLSLVLRSAAVQAMDEPLPAASADPVAPPPTAAPGPSGSAAAGGKAPDTVPKDSTVTQRGAVTVVDVGINAHSLRDELATQRAEASKLHQKLVVMTYADNCKPCADFLAAIPDPLMQAAMKDVRLVRVHTRVFRDDLLQLRLHHNRSMDKEPIPGFFLLGVDLSPRDGIHGGEWDDDIPKNIAPVLGAFVQERYKTRRARWKPVGGGGIRL